MAEGVCGRNGCQWTIAEADIFCGLCGNRVASVEISPAEVCLYQGSTEAEEPIHIQIENTGLNRILVEQVQLDLRVKARAAEVIHWDREGAPDETPEGKVLLPGERVRVRLDLPSELWTKHGGGRGFIVFETTAGDARTDIKVLPPFEVSVPDEEVLIVGEGEHVLEVPVTCVCGRGSIEDVSAESPWVRAIWPGRAELTKERPLDIEFAVSGQELADATGNTALSLEIRAKWRRAPFQFTIPIAYADPPELAVGGGKGKRVEILEGEDGVMVKWRLSNGGQLPLEIKSVTVDCKSPGHVELVSPVLDVDGVHVLQVGESLDLEARVSAGGLPVGNYEASIRIAWRGLGRHAGAAIRVRDPEGVKAVFLEQQETLRLTVCVQRIETEGEAAIDFGTTSSCCAVWDPSASKHELVPLDPEEPEPTVMRTAVVYEEAREEQGIRPWVFGREAVRNSRMLVYADAAVLSIKRDVGSEKEKRITVRGTEHGRQPRTVVADLLADLRRRMVYSTRRQPRRLVLTVPAMFSGFERDALREAAKAAGLPFGEKDLVLIEEPIAAAASFFIKAENRRKYKLGQTYTLLVCDIGGGTTDVCLLRIEDKQTAGHRRLVVETLAMGGNPRFGGDDITRRLARRILRKCAEKDEKYRDLPYSQGAIRSERDLDYERAASGNRNILEKLADDAKIKLGAGRKSVGLGRLFLSFPGSPRQEGPRDLALLQEDLHNVICDDLDVICSMIRGLLDWADDKYQLQLRDGHPDLVFLAGRSCNILSIREQLKSHFGKRALVFNPGTCKECVVEGALELYHRERRPSNTFRLERPPRDSCSAVAVGVDVPCDDRLGMRFEPVIPQFGELDKWHALTFDHPGQTVECNVYESYSPGDSQVLENSPFTRVIGCISKDIPAEVLRLCADGHPFRIEMKLDSAGRELGVRASIGDEWYDQDILNRAAVGS